MAATGCGLVGCLLLMLMRGVLSMTNCDTESAICSFNGRLQGTILFQEKHGFGCSSFGDADGLHVQIDLQGFDPQDRVTSHNFRIKSYAGLMPNCSGMGPDYGQGLRGADLGTFPESKGGVVQISDVRLQNGPTLKGAQSIVGRSVAVMKGQDPLNRFQPRQQTLGCCIIGVANLDGLGAGSSAVPSTSFTPPAPNFNPPSNPSAPFSNGGSGAGGSGGGGGRGGGGFNNFNNGGSGGGGGGFNNFNNQPASSSTYGPFAASAIRRQSAATRPSPQDLSSSFTNSAFRSPFGLGDRFSFFDLSGKTSVVDSVLPDSVKDKFNPPEPPRFQDIYGLDSGESPLGRSGYGNSVRPERSQLSKMFFKDKDIKSTVGFKLTPEEMDIPRESGEEESSKSYHADTDVEKDPGYDDALEGPNADYDGDGPPDVDGPPSGAANSFDTPQPAGPLPDEYGTSDISRASFLPVKGQNYDDDTLENIDINQSYHNGKLVEADEDAPPAAGTVPHNTGEAGGEESGGSTDGGPVTADSNAAMGPASVEGNSEANDAAAATSTNLDPSPPEVTNDLPAAGDPDSISTSDTDGQAA